MSDTDGGQQIMDLYGDKFYCNILNITTTNDQTETVDVNTDDKLFHYMLAHDEVRMCTKR